MTVLWRHLEIMSSCFHFSSIVEGGEPGRRWHRLNLTEAIRTVKVPRVVKTPHGTRNNSQESQCSFIRQSSATSMEEAGPDTCPESSSHGKFTRLRQCEEISNVVLLDSGTASIEETSSARSLAATGKCNGRLQRTTRIEETEAAERSWRVQEQEPLVPPSVPPVPGLLPLNSRCNVQTSGWL